MKTYTDNPFATRPLLQGEPKRILCVEHDAVSLFQVALAVRHRGHIPVFATNLFEAMRELKNIDAVLCGTYFPVARFNEEERGQIEAKLAKLSYHMGQFGPFDIDNSIGRMRSANSMVRMKDCLPEIRRIQKLNPFLRSPEEMDEIIDEIQPKMSGFRFGIYNHLDEGLFATMAAYPVNIRSEHAAADRKHLASIFKTSERFSKLWHFPYQVNALFSSETSGSAYMDLEGFDDTPPIHPHLLFADPGQTREEAQVKHRWMMHKGAPEVYKNPDIPDAELDYCGHCKVLPSSVGLISTAHVLGKPVGMICSREDRHGIGIPFVCRLASEESLRRQMPAHRLISPNLMFVPNDLRLAKDWSTVLKAMLEAAGAKGGQAASIDDSPVEMASK